MSAPWPQGFSGWAAMGLISHQAGLDGIATFLTALLGQLNATEARTGRRLVSDLSLDLEI